MKRTTITLAALLAAVKAQLGRVFRQIGVLDRTSAALWARDNLDA